MPTKGSVIAFNVPEVLPKILFLTVIKSPANKNGFFLDPGEAVEEYLIFFLNKVKYQ